LNQPPYVIAEMSANYNWSGGHTTAESVLAVKNLSDEMEMKNEIRSSHKELGRKIAAEKAAKNGSVIIEP